MVRASRPARYRGFITGTVRALRAGGVALVLAVVAGGCGGAGAAATPASGNPPPAAQPDTGPPASPPVVANRAPTISGTPPRSAVVDEPYRFQPAAADADGDRLSYEIASKPGWASFDAATGRLSGTPGVQHVGTYSDVRLSVSDGKATAALAPFTITVDAIAAGQATLSWIAPTQNADGSVLTDLAGYRIYYGRAADELDEVLKATEGLTTLVIENLGAGTWYFAMTALNSKNAESERSSVVSKAV